MEKQLIKNINARHIPSVDKLYRMHGGLASELVGYRNQTMQLKINLTEKWPKPPLETARLLAQSWKKANPELADGVFFDVKLNGLGEESHFKGKIEEED